VDGGSPSLVTSGVRLTLANVVGTVRPSFAVVSAGSLVGFGSCIVEESAGRNVIPSVGLVPAFSDAVSGTDFAVASRGDVEGNVKKGRRETRPAKAGTGIEPLDGRGAVVVV
jgi:hypothetical protein